MSYTNYDIIISGAGFVGKILSISLQKAGFSVLLIDKNNIFETPEDLRRITISLTGKKILDNIGLWDDLENYSTPINDIFICAENYSSFINFDHKTFSDEPLGYVIKGSNIQEIVTKKIQNVTKDTNKPITVIEKSSYSNIEFNGRKVHLTLDNGQQINSFMLICCEGKNSILTKKYNIKIKYHKYRHYSLICDLKLANNKKHNNVAYENFFKTGPIALLPCEDNKMGLILTSDYLQINNLMKSDNQVLVDYLNKKIDYEIAEVVGNKISHPISLNFSLKYFHEKILFMGDVIHGIHPVAGQGLNISLYDISCLINKIKIFGIKDNTSLIEFQKERLKKNLLMISFTHSVLKIFERKECSIKYLRNLGLQGVENCSTLKLYMMKNAMGIGNDY
ncbi:hypothetical protein GUI12_02745 [Anaplasmataceae bacterium AB001_6]|nr:hypothetical protein GUI12_02745 [Anaplasmataceae bacterium AB001_6]